MGEQDMFLGTIQDLETIEHVPLAARLSVCSTYELIREAATQDPERTAIALLSGRDRSDRAVQRFTVVDNSDFSPTRLTAW